MPSGFQAFGSAEGFVGSGTPGFPVISNLKLRLESDLGVTQASNLVSAWTDQTGTCGDFAAAGGARPTLVANQIGTVPAIRFDGSATKMDTSGSGVLLSAVLGAGPASAFKMIGVFKNTNSTFNYSATSYGEPNLLSDATAGFFGGISADKTNISGGFFTTGFGDHIVTSLQTPGPLVYVESTLTAAAGGTLSLQVGTGGTPVTATGQHDVTQTNHSMNLGVSYDGTIHFKGDLFALYLATSMTAGEVAALQAYLHTKYGV